MAFTDFGAYSYQAWASRPPFSTGPWEAWFEIRTPDHNTLLAGPTKLPKTYLTREEAAAEAEKQAQWEISHNIGRQSDPVKK